MTDDETPTPPPGMTVLTAAFDNWSMTTGAILSSPGHPDRSVLIAVRQHGTHLDAIGYDQITRQPIRDLSPIAPHIERFVADVVGLLVDMTTDADGFHVHTIDASTLDKPTWLPLDPEPGRKVVN